MSSGTERGDDVVLRLDGVAKSYDGGRVVAVDGVDLTVRRGELLAVTGPSGSGKSTLLNLMGLLDLPDAGAVHLAADDGGATGSGGADATGWDCDTAASEAAPGRRVSARAARRRRAMAARRGRGIGFLFQDGLLDQARTSRENVLLGLRFARVPRAARPSLAEAALVDVGLAERVDAVAATLSGGERQRVALARAVAHRPPLLLCDEPTGNLDDDSSEVVFALLAARARAGAAVVVVTHDTELAARCGSWAELRRGALTWVRREPAR